MLFSFSIITSSYKLSKAKKYSQILTNTCSEFIVETKFSLVGLYIFILVLSSVLFLFVFILLVCHTYFVYFNITTYLNAKQGLQFFMFGNNVYSRISKIKNFRLRLCKNRVKRVELTKSLKIDEYSLPECESNKFKLSELKSKSQLCSGTIEPEIKTKTNKMEKKGPSLSSSTNLMLYKSLKPNESQDKLKVSADGNSMFISGKLLLSGNIAN